MNVDLRSLALALLSGMLTNLDGCFDAVNVYLGGAL